MRLGNTVSIAFILVVTVVVAGLMLVPTSVSARKNEVSDWPIEDFALYPPFCRARILKESKELEAHWSQQLGPKNYLHIHHYCHGLRAMTLAYSNFNDPQRRTVFANSVIGNFEYILQHTEPNFYLRDEALLNLARGYVLLREYDNARKKFQEALRQNPQSVDAWVAFSDMYYQNGNKAEALKVLEKALEVAGEHKKITLRIEELKESGRKDGR